MDRWQIALAFLALLIVARALAHVGHTLIGGDQTDGQDNDGIDLGADAGGYRSESLWRVDGARPSAEARSEPDQSGMRRLRASNARLVARFNRRKVEPFLTEPLDLDALARRVKQSSNQCSGGDAA